MRIAEGTYLELRIEGGKLVMVPIPDPFWLALKGSKFIKSSLEEIENISEEEQSRYMKNKNSFKHHIVLEKL